MVENERTGCEFPRSSAFGFSCQSTSPPGGGMRSCPCPVCPGPLLTQKLPAKPPICPLISGRLSQDCAAPPYVRYSLLRQIFNSENKDQVFTLKIFVIKADKRQTCMQRYFKPMLIILEGYGSCQSSHFFYEDFFDSLSPKWEGNLF